MIGEEWKDIQGYEGLYQVSNMGRVVSFQSKHPHILRPKTDKDGYKEVNLYSKGKAKMHKVHRLVATAFLDNPNGHPQINHINEIKDDNRFENLEWVSAKENVNHGTSIERGIRTKVKHPFICIETGKVYWSQTEFAREIGGTQQAVYHVLKGNYKTTHGYHLQYCEGVMP